MNRTLLAGIVVVIALLAIIWYFMSMQTAIAPDTVQVATTTVDTVVPATTGRAASTDTTGASPVPKPAAAKPKTYTSLITQKGNYECLFDQSGTSGKTQNAIHISDGKLHAEFRTFSAAGTKAHSMVYDGRFLYVWDEGSTRGTRTELYKLSDFPSLIPTDLTSGKIFNQGQNAVGYDCHTWLVVALMLVPKNITFN